MSENEQNLLSVKEQIYENQQIINALNEKLERKSREVRVIQQISNEINSTLDLDAILNSILHSMDEVLGFQHSMILLVNDEGNMLKVAASRGYSSKGIGSEVKFGQGVIGIVAKRKRIVRMGNIRSQLQYSAGVKARMADAGEGARFTETIPLPGLSDVDSQIGIPLLMKDKLVGVFSVESSTPNAFDELDEMLLMILANQAASVIDNARLYLAEKERLQQLNQAYTALSQLNESLEEKVNGRTFELSKALDEVSLERKRSMDLLERMAPPEVIPLLLEDKLMARRMTSTVLFADLEGFTSYTSNMEPDEIFSQLNFFFSQSSEQIHTYRGYINKTNGDSIMALFGVPNESKTHAIDAVLAGLKMQSEIDHHFKLNMRIGINTGTITAGMLGPDNKSLYDVLGDAVNVASRMEKICKPGGVTISEDTYRLVEPYFEIERLGIREVKGKGEIETYQVHGIRSIQRDPRRIEETSKFFKLYLPLIQVVEQIKEDHLSAVDFVSIQSRDGAMNHNEATASFALALLRYLKEKAATSPDLASHRAELEEISETDMVMFMLLHDLGKYSIDPVLLNNPTLDQDSRYTLIDELCRHTIHVLEQLELQAFIPSLEKFYQFQRTKGAVTDPSPHTVIAAVADLYDALTAPKLYKGRPWSIQGTLEEILRMPYVQTTKCPIALHFIELFRPELKKIEVAKKTNKLFK